MKPIRDFFWFCSGATRSVLKRSPIDSEKYAGIGATVFFTGLFASLSAGYALFTVFNNLLIASVAGLLWGLMIFNLDRYIVSSMVKRDRFWPEFKLLLPRLALAILLALVISKPLELKIFEREINRQLDIKKSEEIISTRESIRKGLPEMEQLENRISLLKNEITAKASFRDQKQQEYNSERFGTKTSGTTGIAGLGTNARKKEQQLNEAQEDLKNTEERVNARIMELENRITLVQEQAATEFARQRVSIDRYDGLAARIEALSRLTAGSTAMYYANLFLILLFIAIEIAPILIKFISLKGHYDDLLEIHENEIKNYKEERITRSRIRSEARILTFTDVEKHQVEEAVSRERKIRQKFGEAEDEILQATVEHWKEEEKGKMIRTPLNW